MFIILLSFAFKFSVILSAMEFMNLDWFCLKISTLQSLFTLKSRFLGKFQKREIKVPPHHFGVNKYEKRGDFYYAHSGMLILHKITIFYHFHFVGKVNISQQMLIKLMLTKKYDVSAF